MTQFFNAKINEAYSFYMAFRASADDDTLQANPTWTAGDAQHSGDGGAFANLATLPAVGPAAGRGVLITLSQAEMNYSNILLTFEDASGTEEWKAESISIHTYAVDVDELVRSTTPANTFDVSSGGEGGLDWANIGSPTSIVGLTNTTCSIVTTLTNHTPQTGDSYARIGAPAGASVSADVAAIKAETALIVADTNELQTDWTNGGRLDLLLDATLADTNELQVDWTNGGRLDLLIDLILADTGELQTDWANGGRLDLLIDAILADTGELQTDWVNGGRLDLLLDAILSDTNAILVDTGTSGVLINLAQAISEGQSARTIGGAFEVSEANERNLISVVGGVRTLYQSNKTSILVSRTQSETALTP